MGVFITWTSFAFVSLYLLFTCNVSAQSISNPTQDDDGDICKKVFCGKGTCHHSSTELLGFRCDCDSGWMKFNNGLLPPCIIPNCTVDLKCANGSPPPLLIPPLNATDPCLLNLCGDGTCERNGPDFRCQCNEGSANLLNDPKMICIKKCTLGGDCNGLDLGFNTPSPPDSGNGSPKTGSGEMLKCSREFVLLTMMILAIVFQNW